MYLVITNDDNGSEIRIKIMLNTVVTREKKIDKSTFDVAAHNTLDRKNSVQGESEQM